MYDIIIRNGEVLDGTGSPSFVADIAVKNGKIEKIAAEILENAKTEIDATGLVVTPGFIDSHSHSDNAIIDFPDMIEKVEQGITTAIAGQCGNSIAPQKVSAGNDAHMEGVGLLSEALSTFGKFAESFRDYPLGSNNVCFIGHGAIRKMVMGMSQEAPTEEELLRMKSLVRDAMEHGALGMSLGLIYPPGIYAKTDELIELAKVVGEYGGLVVAHIRDESVTLIEATEEFIEIIRRSDARGVLSHHKACGSPKNWGKVKKTLRLIDEANADGLDIHLDVYPYEATHTSASVTFVHDSGRDLINRLGSEEERKKMREHNRTTWWKDDFSWVQVARCEGYPEYEGLFVPEAAKLHGKDGYETILDMIYKSNDNCSCCYFTICEDDIMTVMAHPRAMICTDATVAKGKTMFHPRVKGSFPRTLGRYVREKKVVPLPEMIRKMTSLPASVYGLASKGILKEGMDADICIFDFEKIIDHSDFLNCNMRADGLNFVIVSGEVVAENAIYNGKRAGKLILKNNVHRG